MINNPQDLGPSGVSDNGSTAYVCGLAAIAALGGLLFGYDTGVISGVIGFLTDRFALDEVMQGWAVSNVLIGCMVGASLAGTLSDRFGRKKMLILAAMLFAVSAIASALPRNLTEFVIARFIGGMGVGMASILSPLYIAEVSPANIRGRLVSLNQVTIIVGFLIVCSVNWMIASENQEWNVQTGWRWMLASETLPAIVFLAALFFVPESPRWLTKQGRRNEAMGILTRIGGRKRAQEQMLEIEEAISHAGARFRELLRPGIRKALVIAVLLAILQQLTGINAIMYYAPEIFKRADVSVSVSLLLTTGVQIVNLLFTLISIYMVDRLGRKPLLLCTSIAMGISLLLLGAAFYWHMPSWWLVILIYTYVASFGFAMGPVVWVVLSEFFPTRTRGRAMSVAIFSLWVACFTLSQTVPWMFKHIGEAGTFWTYAAMCVVMLIVVGGFVPETKGKTLEEIEKTWARDGK
ncbi:MAG: sugar porter family MFS transporter [Pirellulales bacterium]|nr:sugar porter family MFS transporter [Pirellulales bacterium]